MLFLSKKNMLYNAQDAAINTGVNVKSIFINLNLKLSFK